MRVRVSGTGNFDGLSLPALPPNRIPILSWNQFLRGGQGDPLGLSGTKNFEVVLVPEQSGLQRLRWPVLTSWDPVEKKYVTEEGVRWQFRFGPARQSGATSRQQRRGVGGSAVVRTGPVSGDLALKTELGACSGSPVLW